MKARKIFITSIIVNILTIGVIYNIIKKDYLNTEKIIVKSMTGTEYEDHITELNQSHTDYANYIEECKTQIASAITEKGIETSNEETLENMANNIRSIPLKNTNVWFENGVFNTEHIMGEPEFYYSNTNLNDYATDGYLYFPNHNNTYGCMVYSKNLIPRGMYSKVEVTFLLINQYGGGDAYRYGFGMSSTKSKQTNTGNFRTSKFSKSETVIQTQTYDLSFYNTSNEDMYFFIGGTTICKIYKIEFYKL